MQINWTSLAEEMGLVEYTDHGRTERGGGNTAKVALERILGGEALRAAVDHYVSGAPGGELARSVLWLLHPPSAMERCLEIFRTSPDLDERRSSIELLGVVADARVLAWVPEFLADADPLVQSWGIHVVDQMLMNQVVDIEDCEACILLGEAHENEDVRTRAAFIRECWPDVAP